MVPEVGREAALAVEVAEKIVGGLSSFRHFTYGVSCRPPRHLSGGFERYHYNNSLDGKTILC